MSCLYLRRNNRNYSSKIIRGSRNERDIKSRAAAIPTEKKVVLFVCYCFVNDCCSGNRVGDIVVTVSGDFGNVSTYCYYHGYMGGENLLEYKSTCSP